MQVRVWVQARKSSSGELNGQTWSSGHQKRIETAIKQYTRRSDAQRVIEQKDLLIWYDFTGHIFVFAEE